MPYVVPRWTGRCLLCQAYATSMAASALLSSFLSKGRLMHLTCLSVTAMDSCRYTCTPKGVPQTPVDSFFRALVSTSTLQGRSRSFDELKKRDRPFLLPKHPRSSISTKRRMYTRYLGTKSDSLRGRYRATWNSWLVDRLAYECLVTKQIAPRSVYSPRDVVGPLQCSMLKSSVDRGA